MDRKQEYPHLVWYLRHNEMYDEEQKFIQGTNDKWMFQFILDHFSDAETLSSLKKSVIKDMYRFADETYPDEFGDFLFDHCESQEACERCPFSGVTCFNA